MKKMYRIGFFLVFAFAFGFLSPNTSHAQVSEAPRLDSVTAGDSEVTLSWSAPGNQGGSAVSAYQISYLPQGGSEVLVNTGNVLTHKITGLTNGTLYRFSVKARNLSGFSVSSNQLQATPESSATAPATPSAPTLSAGNGTINISWSAPNNGGSAITSYTVGYTRQGQAEQTVVVNAPTTSHQLTGLTGGFSYLIRVRATNAVGSGSYSSQSSTTSTTTPGTPLGLEVTPGDGTLSLSWTAPASSGSAVTSYGIFYEDQESNTTTEIDTDSTDTTYTISELTNGRDYIIKVRAENALGYGSYSSQKLVAPDVNAEPVLVGTPNVIPTNTGATITWSTNKSMSSSIDYGLITTAVSTTEYNTVARVVEHTVTLSGLLPCTSYSYRVNSKDSLNQTVSSTQKNFTTTGCPKNATVLSTQRDSVVVADGGIVDFTDTDIKARFDIPSEVTCVCSVMTVQAKQLDKEAVQTTLEAPNKKNWLGDHVYNFTAYKDEDEIVESFDLPVDVSIEYTREDVEGINLDTLGIYHYNDDTEEWSTLTDCDNIYDPRTGTGTITCKTSSFSTFVLASLEEDEIQKPSFRERFKKFFSRAFGPMSFKKFSRCGTEKPE
jgi:hypothetical protein